MSSADSDEGDLFGSLVEDHGTVSPETMMLARRELAHLEAFFCEFFGNVERREEPRDVNIVRSRFPLDDEDQPPLKSIGDAWGISRERVRQIEARVILRHAKTDPKLLNAIRCRLIELRRLLGA